jgi:hypothetical protein
VSRRSAFAWAIAWSALTVATLATWGDVLPGPLGLRAAIVLTFSTVGVGLAWVRLLRLKGPLPTLVAATVLGVSLTLLTAFAQAVSGRWSPGVGLAFLIVASGIGVAAWLAVGDPDPPEESA